MNALEVTETVYRFDRPKAGRATYVRGSMFTAVPAFTKDYLGHDGWHMFLQQLQPATAAVMKTEFLALAWYPFSVVADVAQAVHAAGKALGKKNPLSDMARANLDQGTRGLFRAIFKIGSPEFMISRADFVWSKCFTNGYMSTPIAERGRATVRLRGVPDMTAAYSTSILYSLEAVIRKAGARAITAEMTSDLAKGDDVSEYSYRWS